MAGEGVFRLWLFCVHRRFTIIVVYCRMIIKIIGVMAVEKLILCRYNKVRDVLRQRSNKNGNMVDINRSNRQE